jgi:hypothetical protein
MIDIPFPGNDLIRENVYYRTVNRRQPHMSTREYMINHSLNFSYVETTNYSRYTPM